MNFATKPSFTTTLIAIVLASWLPNAGAQPVVDKPDAGEAMPVVGASLLKIVNADAAKGVKRVVLTSCNVLFGFESSADAKTQAGFGQPTAGRVDSKVSTSYTLQGLTPVMQQDIATKACADAVKAFADAGLEVVTLEQLMATAQWKKLLGYGRATPFEWSRAGSKYNLYTPENYKLMEINDYASMSDIFSAIGNASAADGGPTRVEAEMLKQLDASSARVNILVDFAKQSSSNTSGFFSRMAGSDTAKVSSKVQLSVSGHVAFYPLDMLKCWDTVCYTSEAQKMPKFALKEPLLSSRAVILETKDIKTSGKKVDEGLANVFGALVAIAGKSGGSSYSSDVWGVVVDPAVYEIAVRENTRALVLAVAQFTKK